MEKRNFDTQLTGKIAFSNAESIILDAGHFIQAIDGAADKSIDGYIRIRKKVRVKKPVKGKIVEGEDYVETGNLVGVQIKGVSSIPLSGSNSYYITLGDKSKFGVNFSTKSNLDKHRAIWKNFIGPVILIFVDLATGRCWWADVNNDDVHNEAGYFITVDKSNVFDYSAFSKIRKLGKELFSSKQLIEINTKNYDFFPLKLYDFKKSAKNHYLELAGKGDMPKPPTINPTLGEIKYSNSGWSHITRHNRRKMRIFNSLTLIGVSKEICEKVENFTKVKKGMVRETQRFIKKVDFLTLRAKVNYNFRQSSIVQVVLRRVKTFDKVHEEDSISDQIFFHSVYEPYRIE